MTSGTPLAVGYLWLVTLWLLAHRWIPTSVAAAHAGPIKALAELGALLGKAAIFAALSFVAYLLGSILRWQPLTNVGRIIPPTPYDIGGILRNLIFRVMYYRRVNQLYSQLAIFLSSWLRDNDADRLEIDHYSEIFHNNYNWDSQDREK